MTVPETILVESLLCRIGTRHQPAGRGGRRRGREGVVLRPDEPVVGGRRMGRLAGRHRLPVGAASSVGRSRGSPRLVGRAGHARSHPVRPHGHGGGRTAGVAG